jgi:hypothetical protein
VALRHGKAQADEISRRKQEPKVRERMDHCRPLLSHGPMPNKSTQTSNIRQRIQGGGKRNSERRRPRTLRYCTLLLLLPLQWLAPWWRRNARNRNMAAVVRRQRGRVTDHSENPEVECRASSGRRSTKGIICFRERRSHSLPLREFSSDEIGLSDK